jgi:hypothetical protein
LSQLTRLVSSLQAALALHDIYGFSRIETLNRRYHSLHQTTGGQFTLPAGKGSEGESFGRKCRAAQWRDEFQAPLIKTDGRALGSGVAVERDWSLWFSRLHNPAAVVAAVQTANENLILKTSPG